MAKAAQIPAWELTELNKLQTGNELSGVSAEDLGLIDQAESSGSGGGLNKEGYGGWFGLGAGTAYTSPTGITYEDSAAILQDTSVASFDQQAETAGAEFANLLKKYGNPVQAEQAYQTGKPSGIGEGAGIFEAAGDTGNLTSAQLAALNTPGPQGGGLGVATPGAVGQSTPNAGPTLSGAGGIFQDLNNLLNPSGGSLLNQIATLGTSDILSVVEMLFVRGIFAIGFMLVTYAGVKTLSGSGGGGSTSVVQLYNQSQNTQTAKGRLRLDRQRESRIANPQPAATVTTTSSAAPPASEVYRRSNVGTEGATHRRRGGEIELAEDAIAL